MIRRCRTIVGVAGLSSDGESFLLTHFGHPSGTNYGVYLCPTDGSPAIKLGDGRARALSPDGRQALVKLNVPEQLNILPVGAGEACQLPKGNIEHYNRAAWFPDGNRIVFTGNIVGEGRRTLWPLTLEGVSGTRVARGALLVKNDPGESMVYDIDTNMLTRVKGLENGEERSGGTPIVSRFLCRIYSSFR